MGVVQAASGKICGRSIISTPALGTVQTSAGVTLKRLFQASYLDLGDQLLVTGSLAEDALAALVATGLKEVTLIRPLLPYPHPQRADVVWLLGLECAETFNLRLRAARRCLSPGGRILLEIVGSAAAALASTAATRLQCQGFAVVRVEPLSPNVVLVRGDAPLQQQRAA